TNAGFDLAGYCNQTNYLLGNGITQLLEAAEERTDEVGRMRLRNQLKQLTLPTEMGERFQVMAFSRDVDMSASFLLGDLTWRL
ncbi:MAG: class I SAM-dependent methyltransferase, partial [Stenotrophomonas sp.]